MKKIIKLFLFITLFGIFSCTNDDDAVASINQSPVLLQANNTDLVLSSKFDTEKAITLSWHQTDYGVPAEKKYNIEFSKTEDFSKIENAKSIVESNRTATFSVKDFNKSAINTGLIPFEKSKLYIRVVSFIGDNGLKSISNIISLNVTPYPTSLPKLFLIGSFQSESGYGTDNEGLTAPALASSAFGKVTDYEGYVYFDEDNSAFTLSQSDISGNYSATGKKFGNNGGLVEEGSTSNFTVPTKGNYRVQVDLTAKTIKFTKVSWGVIGPGSLSANWSSDIDVVYDKDRKVFSATGSIVKGEYKFRANDDWGLNFGKDDDSDGSLNYGSPNNLSHEINGNATFELDLSKPRQYTQKIIAN